jgi:hypothetical protein
MVIFKKKSSIAKNTKKISERERELKNFLEYLYIDGLLNSSPNEYKSIIYNYLNNYLNKVNLTKIQPPLQPLQPLPAVTTIKEEEYDQEPFVPTEEQIRNLDRVIERSSQMQTSSPRTKVTKEHMEQARVFDQNNNIEITFLKNEIKTQKSNLDTTLKQIKDVTFTKDGLLYDGNNKAKKSLIVNFNNSYIYKSVSESEPESDLKSIISNNGKYLSELNILKNQLKEQLGGKPAKYKSTGITVFILYKNKKYNRTIYVKDKGKTKYCKIKNEYILLSKLKVI